MICGGDKVPSFEVALNQVRNPKIKDMMARFGKSGRGARSDDCSNYSTQVRTKIASLSSRPAEIKISSMPWIEARMIVLGTTLRASEHSSPFLLAHQQQPLLD